MDNGDQIQQTNLVNDNTAAAMDDVGMAPVQTGVEPVTPLPQTEPIPTGSAANPIATATPAFSVPTSDPLNTPVTTPVPPPIPTPITAPVVPEPTPFPAAINDNASVVDADHDELDDIKRNALDELKPLIEHIEQSPEERFETVMMMIRSNDDPKLISSAYEAAKGIDDEKKRASAFLNIVSEIEYLKSKS